MEIKYDTPIEVTKLQYKFLTVYFSGIVAFKEEAGRYFIKVWLMKYAEQIKMILNLKT